MKILVVNCGSSSLKYELLDMDTGNVLLGGLAERIGEDAADIAHTLFTASEPKKAKITDKAIPDHKTALEIVGGLLTDPELGAIKNLDEIEAVGHRVVHGGERFSKTTLVDDSVIQGIRESIPLAPLHNPANLMGIQVAMAMLPGVPQAAVFDTAFHQTMPMHSYLYALPFEYYEKLGVRRYGFHGTSHKYVSERAAEYLGRDKTELRIITAHLGNGGSLAAIDKGKCVDTSMGMTPVAGIIMGTRSGDVDPGIYPYLAKHGNMSVTDIDALLNKKSGLLGICGANDMRDIHAMAQKGDKRARVALDAFAYAVKGFVGRYLAVLGGADALVFTAGIGEHDAVIREMIAGSLDGLGIVMDKAKNKAGGPGILAVHAPESKTAILVIPTNEELEIARQTMKAIKEAG